MASKAITVLPVGVYKWQVPGQPLAIELDLDLVDRLGAEVMRGYSLVPKRGAEVGGLLLGKIDRTGAPIVRIRDFMPIPIEYRRGPSYLLSEQDRIQFAESVDELRRSNSGGADIVGLYRSHTREGLSLTEEDVARFNEFCPDALQVFLLIRPSATRIPEAGFLVREGASLQTLSPTHLFAFRRKYLESGQPPEPAPPTLEVVRREEPAPVLQPSRTVPERTEAVLLPFAGATAHQTIEPPLPIGPAPRVYEAPRPTHWRPLPPPRKPDPIAPPAAATGLTIEAQQVFAQELQRVNESISPMLPRGDAWQMARAASLAALDASSLRREQRTRWMRRTGIGIVCLVLGALAGTELARQSSPSTVAKPVYYEFGLQAEKQPQGISVTWDGRAPGLRQADSAVLRIEDGESEMKIMLTAAELERGSALYHNRTSDLRFRLEVPQGRNSVLMESVELKPERPKTQKVIDPP